MKDFAVLLLRVSSGAFMLFGHGLPKLNVLFSSKEITFFDPFGVGALTSFILVIIAEFLCSIFLIAGLFTRISLIPLIITMFIAAFIYHAGDTFAQIEKSLLFFVIYVVLFINGPGKYSLGRIVKIKNSSKFLKYFFE
jgi:putative oxidoreductase